MSRSGTVGGAPSVPHPLGGARTAERGAVTVEAAVVLTGVALMLVALVWCLVVLGVYLRLQDAARVAALMAARGQPYADIVDEARRVAPGVQVDVEEGSGERVAVTVHQRVAPPLGPLAGIGAVELRGTASALREQS